MWMSKLDSCIKYGKKNVRDYNFGYRVNAPEEKLEWYSY